MLKENIQQIARGSIMLTLWIITTIGIAGTIATLMHPAPTGTQSENLITKKPTTWWRLNSNWQSQRYVPLTGDRITRMKWLLKAYDLDPEELRPAIRTIARIHRIYPEAIICIAYADSSIGRYSKTKNNPGNVWNNDRGNKVNYDNIEQGFNAIARTLNNQYLSYIYSIDYLSRYGNVTGKVYATSPENQFVNLSNCLGMLNPANTWVTAKQTFRR